jgi:hypothetical protein
MALFFYLPRLIYRTLSTRSGIDLLDLVESADDTRRMGKFDERGESLKFEKRDELLKYVVDTIDMYVDDPRRQAVAANRQTSFLRRFFNLLCCMTGKFLGNYFITLYLFIK